VTLTVRSSSVTGATTAGRALTHAQMDANWAHFVSRDAEIQASLAASTGAALVGFTQSGSGAVAETMQSRGRWFGYLTDYLSDANRASIRAGSSVDIATALINALAEHYVVFLPPYTGYTLGSKVTVPANKGIFGFNKLGTQITKAFSGDMFDLSANGSFIQGVYLAGAGATYTGKGIVIGTAGAGKQRVHHVRIDDTAGACIAFDDADAGSQFSGFDLELSRRSSGTGTGNYAVTVVTTAAAAATPRKFSHIETNGNCSFSFGGSNGFSISDSTIGDIEYHANSKDIRIANVRLLNQAALSILGSNNSIAGSDILPNITLSGVGPYTLQGNTYNGTVTDSSTNMNNCVDAPSVAYTPTWTASSVNPAIGDGTLVGEYTRKGDSITLTINLSIGSTTTMGTGDWRFSVPISPNLPTSGAIQTGIARMLDTGTARHVGIARLLNGGTYLEIEATGATLDLVDTNSPFTWAQNDTLLIQITYQL
jgi:hypothetical protein